MTITVKYWSKPIEVSDEEYTIFTKPKWYQFRRRWAQHKWKKWNKKNKEKTNALEKVLTDLLDGIETFLKDSLNGLEKVLIDSFNGS